MSERTSENQPPTGDQRTSPWVAAAPAASAKPTGPRPDVIVVGAGITGLLTSTLLRQQGADVLVVDRAPAGGVATRNTTAKVSALQGRTYQSIARTRGPAGAKAYAAAQLHAVDGIEMLVGDLDIDCGWEEAGAVYFGTDRDSAGTARAEHEAASNAGLSVRWEKDRSLLPFPVDGACSLTRQFHFDPARFCVGLARRLGADAFLQVGVTDVSTRGDTAEITVEGGQTITAQHVVIATQSPISDPALLVNRCKPVQSYASCFEAPNGFPAVMGLSADDSPWSVRPVELDGRPHVIVGGAGHPVGERPDGDPWASIERWARDRMDLGPMTHHWGTHDLVTRPTRCRSSVGSDRVRRTAGWRPGSPSGA